MRFNSGGLGTTSSDLKWQPLSRVEAVDQVTYLKRVELQNGCLSLGHNTFTIHSYRIIHTKTTITVLFSSSGVATETD